MALLQCGAVLCCAVLCNATFSLTKCKLCACCSGWGCAHHRPATGSTCSVARDSSSTGGLDWVYSFARSSELPEHDRNTRGPDPQHNKDELVELWCQSFLHLFHIWRKKWPETLSPQRLQSSWYRHCTGREGCASAGHRHQEAHCPSLELWTQLHHLIFSDFLHHAWSLTCWNWSASRFVFQALICLMWMGHEN